LEVLGDAWNAAILRPMINSLVLLYYVFFHNFGLSIIVFTIIVRLLMFPLTVKQARYTKKMGELAPRLKEIQTKYPNDRQKQSQETLKVYREAGFHPLGCLGPVLIQFPIWIGLYQAIQQTLPTTPDRLADLSRHLYSWTAPIVHDIIPLSANFLWMDLATPDPTVIVLPLLVGVSMFFMQKMSMTPATSPSQESTNRMMLWMLPIMFGFFTIQFSSGLAVYWIVSNVIGIVIQGFITGWEPMTSVFRFRRGDKPVAASAALAPPEQQEVTESNDENDRDIGKDGGRGNRTSSKGTRRRAHRSRNKRR
jgi:YidC/Oxa1 family membrane protein insertase